MSPPRDTLPPLSVRGRLERLRALLPTAGPEGSAVDALLVGAAANVRWLTGFSGSAGLLLVTGDGALLTTDGRYRAQSDEQLRLADVADEVTVVVGGLRAQREAVADRAAGRPLLGLEADHVTWSEQRAWAELFPTAELVATRGTVEVLREVKDDAELARMARAAAIADEALDAVLPFLAGAGRADRPALTETRFGAALDHAMRERGAEGRAFETIVASGENAAKPHARPGERRIGPGDPVVVDFGAVCDGYRSDMTRTFCVGSEPTGELARLFEVVAESQRDGVAAVRPGAVCEAVDDACRSRIASRGLADRFEHGTGHGVGLDIHEAPAVAPGSTAILAAGTVVTVEPGVYLPGTGGVRIEDTLVVTEHGSRPLTQFPKEVAV